MSVKSSKELKKKTIDRLLSRKIDEKSFFEIEGLFTNNVDVYSVCFSSCSNYLFTGDFNGNLKKWSLSNGDMVLEHRLHLTVIRRLKLSLDGKYLLTGSSGWKSTAKIVDPEDLSVFHKYYHEMKIKALNST
eukprot:TRINITY_DN3030_c4_g1_i3.p1 TRINITY_DN3030_c4_g1~~TRINITY_DN3030_c4_g1_i3.p1  ORF type:complete len:132 (-),score=26.41 TRINITY_DN3030_c4_g1_i3:279-674(-)